MEYEVGLNDQTTEALSRIEARLFGKAMKKALVETAKPLKTSMKTMAPRRSGALRRSIGHKTEVDYKKKTVSVKVGLIYRKSNRKGYVAGLMQERGTIYMKRQPFIEPSEQQFPKVEEDLRKFIQAQLDEL